MRENWSDNERDGEVKDFGQIVIDLEEQDYELPCDDEMAQILGWDGVPTDDEAEPYFVLGIARSDGQEALVFSMSRNLAIGHDYTYASSYRITKEQSTGVKSWIEARCAEVDAAKDKARQIQELFKANGLDDSSIRERRYELLEKHGLNLK